MKKIMEKMTNAEDSVCSTIQRCASMDENYFIIIDPINYFYAKVK